MVDRVVPRPRDADAPRWLARSASEDRGAVVAEPFRHAGLIDGASTARGRTRDALYRGRPRAPHEALKLRAASTATHSLLAYLGPRSVARTVAEAWALTGTSSPLADRLASERPDRRRCRRFPAIDVGDVPGAQLVDALGQRRARSSGAGAPAPRGRASTASGRRSCGGPRGVRRSPARARRDGDAPAWRSRVGALDPRYLAGGGTPTIARRVARAGTA